MCEKCNHNHHPEDECYLPIIQQNTDNVFFGVSVNDDLPNLRLLAGANLTSILKKIDYKLGDIPSSTNYGAFNLAYLSSKYTVDTVKNFSESVSLELAYNNTRVNQLLTVTGQQGTNITNLTTKVEGIRLPQLLDNSGVGFTVNDTINTVLQKIINKFNNISSTGSSFNLTSIDTNTVDLTLTGTNNSNIKADVKVSNTPNNRLQKNSDGLYVASTATNSNQTLDIDGNFLSISGGNTVTIPVSGLQSLSLTGNRLIISGSNYVDLPPSTETILTANNSTSINFFLGGTSSHIINASVKVSATNGNIIKVNANDGLYALTDAAEVLSQINVDTTLKTTFCNIVNDCNKTTCYSFHAQNLTSATITLSYEDQNGLTQSVSVIGNSSYFFNGRKVKSFPSTTLVISFLGQC